MKLAAEALFTIAAFALLGAYVWHMTSPPRAAVEPTRLYKARMRRNRQKLALL